MVLRCFMINETKYVIVRLGNSAHVMTEKEWNEIDKQLHLEKRKSA